MDALPSPVEYTGSSGPYAFAGDDVVTYDSQDRIALIRINRPAQRNVINAEATNRLHDAWLRFNASNDLVAVLTGAGNETFCASSDTTDGYGTTQNSSSRHPCRSDLCKTMMFDVRHQDTRR